jgi:DNA-directed RNA polymerase specialized sigma24 family protein
MFTDLSRPAGAAPHADEACLEVFEQELDYIHATLKRLGATSSDVEDLMHEVFLALRRSWRRFDRGHPPRPQLFRIAFRIASAHRQEPRRAAEKPLRSDPADPMMLSALDRIPLDRRAVLIIHDFDERPLTEAACLLDVSLLAAHLLLRKARRELASAMRNVRSDLGEFHARVDPDGRRPAP